jgi:hypothetical protein
VHTPHELSLLTPGECGEVYARILALRERWTPRSPELPFHTLGVASYLDAASVGGAGYREKARASNPLLRAEFGALHERLAELLAGDLGDPVFTSDDLAFPGFHVFGYHQTFTQPMASIHFDQQYEHIDFGELGVPSAHLSVTLAIRLPACGAGLRLWPVFYEELAAIPAAERKVKLSGLEPVLHRYAEGKLVVHSGHQLHQIAPAPGMRPEDERITLQAHLARVTRGWVMYW